MDYGWSDIGSWATLWHELDRDANGNATDGAVVLRDTRNSLVRSEDGILTAVIGAEDLVVVATSDAVLVVPRTRSEAVKELVEKLKAGHHAQATEHKRIYRPWGYYQAVDAGPRWSRCHSPPATESRPVY